MIKKVLITSIALTFSFGIALAQEEAELETSTKLEEADATEESSETEETPVFSFETFAENYLLIDEKPDDFPNQNDYENYDLFKEAVIDWCKNNKELVDPEKLEAYEQKELRQQNANR